MERSATLNAKQRRKLLREQQHQKQEGSTSFREEERTKKEEITATVTGNRRLHTTKQHQLTQRANEKTDEVNDKKLLEAVNTVTIDTDQPMNARQRRLLHRQTKRKLEGVENTKPVQKKQKKEEDAEQKSIHLTLFVGQLPFQATEDMIRKHFSEAGDIKLRMRTDKKTKKFKDTAFIEVKDSKALGAALSRHHTLLQGRRINVELTASGGGNKSENRRNKISLLRKKQGSVQVEKTKALIQKHIDRPEYKLKQEDVDDRMIDFLSWFDYETAKYALDEYNRCVSDRVNNRKAFFMGILKRFRQTDGEE